MRTSQPYQHGGPCGVELEGLATGKQAGAALVRQQGAYMPCQGMQVGEANVQSLYVNADKHTLAQELHHRHAELFAGLYAAWCLVDKQAEAMHGVLRLLCHLVVCGFSVPVQVSTVLGAALEEQRKQGEYIEGIAIWVAVAIVIMVGEFPQQLP